MNATQAKLIMVSNRLPVKLRTSGQGWEATPSSGGLVSALSGVTPQMSFDWVGWSGADVPSQQQTEVRQLLTKHRLHPVFLQDEQIDRFYNGFSNSVLWPLFHYLPNLVDFSLRFWDEYKQVNELFAEQVLALCEEDTTVWIHDYHLFLLPELLKRRRPDLKIGFFLHIPFPSSEIFRLLPVRREILRGVLGSDLIGFHTHDYMRHFSSTCLRVLGLEASTDQVLVDGRSVRIGAFPIGINAEEFISAGDQPEVQAHYKTLDESYPGKRILLGVDRLDYIKGLTQKLDAYEAFLERYPEWSDRVTLLQIVVPSRGDVRAYQELREEIERRVGHINGRFGTPSHTPIQYMHQSVPFEQLCALYERADVLLVSSIRDGMNLVSFEYTACQSKRSGVLLLSEFAGAAPALSSALLLNPWDRSSFADAIQQALTMPEDERQQRAAQNLAYVREHSSMHWAKRFVRTMRGLSASTTVREDLREHYLPLQRGFMKAKERLFLLDYDGTLTGFVPQPDQARPDEALLATLRQLCEPTHNHVYIISGRSPDQLAAWLGDIPGIGLSAEHGMFFRAPHTQDWERAQAPDESWMEKVAEILSRYVEMAYGSFVERKRSSLVWHYRKVDEERGEWAAYELYLHLEKVLANLPVEVLHGNKIVEIRSQSVHKGNVVKRLLAHHPDTDWTLCLGDDRTDEDMFRALPSDAWTCRIGASFSEANYHLDNVEQVREILEALALLRA